MHTKLFCSLEKKRYSLRTEELAGFEPTKEFTRPDGRRAE
jgi:hypothetical protein